jgi:hypothetical protein
LAGFLFPTPNPSPLRKEGNKEKVGGFEANGRHQCRPYKSDFLKKESKSNDYHQQVQEAKQEAAKTTFWIVVLA